MHAPAQAHARIGRDRVAVKQRRRIDHGRSRVEDDEIGVAAHRDRALAAVRPASRAGAAAIQVATWSSDSPRRARRSTPRRARAGARRCRPTPPRNRRRRCDFSAGGRRRMIGRDEVDVALRERLPQRFAMPRLADRRRALEGGRARRRSPRRRTSGSAGRSRPMIGRPGARGPRAARERVRRREVHDVDVGAGTRAPGESADRSPPARSPADVTPARSGSRADRRADRARAAPPAARHGRAAAGRARAGSAAPRADRLRSTCANSSTPDGDRKHLNPSTPAPRERLERAGVARDDAAPEPDVDVTPPVAGAQLGIEPVRRRWSPGCC